MREAPLHPQETDRLDALRAYRILDTATEEAYDEITRLAASICDAPIAVISLVDRDRQWFKSRFGLDAEQTPRSVAFCAHAILERGVFEVPDATQDARFHDNPLVAGAPDIRFYAGAPLVTPDDLPIGTLCVIDRTPRALSPAQRTALETLGRQVVTLLELRDKVRAVEARAEALARSNRKLDHYATLASHDFKEPLRRIHLFAARLRREVAQDEAAPPNTYLNSLERAAGQMTELVEGMLELARLRTEPAPATAVPLDEVAAQVAEVLAAPLAASDGQLLVDPLPVVDGDPREIFQLLSHLVRNALKFRAEDRPPIVTVRSAAHAEHPRLPDATGDLVELVVADNGIGFDPARAERIFDVFRHLHPSKEYEGIGLGLALCREIVERRGGVMWADARPGEGASFHVLLPASRGEDPGRRAG